jgi:hypothetical protein
MRIVIGEIFHIYVIGMMAAFFLLCTLAGEGFFDKWHIRYMKRKSDDEILKDNELV